MSNGTYRYDEMSDWLNIDFVIFILTEDSKPVVECDDENFAIGGQDSAVEQISGAPIETFSVDKNHHGISGFIFQWQRGTWKNGYNNIKIWLNCRYILIHEANSDHEAVITIFVRELSIRPSSALTFQNLAKKIFFQVKTVIATGGTVGLAEWFIDGTRLVYCIIALDVTG